MKKRDWEPYETLEIWLARNISGASAMDVPLRNLHQRTEPGEVVPLRELEVVVMKAARLVGQLGPQYIDVFERAEKELQLARERLNTMERIKHLTSATLHQSESNLIEP